MTGPTASRGWFVPLCLALLLSGLTLPGPAVDAASTLHVTNCTDSGVSGDGSLRGEIVAAGVGDTIVFDLNCTGATAIVLRGGTLALTKNVTIDGTGHTIIVDGGCTACDPTSPPGVDGVRVFFVATGVTANLNTLTIQHGNPGPGSGIFNSGGTLTVSNSTITNNADEGINNTGGTLSVANSTISLNSLNISSSMGGGGGIDNESGTVTVTTSTVSDNNADVGGGILNFHGTLTVTNSTVARNFAFSGGAGILNDGGTTTTTVTNSTIVANESDGIFGVGGIENNPEGTLTVTNTIVAGNINVQGPSPADLGGVITSGGHNLVGKTNGTITNGVNGDIVNPTPKLGPLGNNGGTTQTIALLTGSPAIDAGNDAVCAQTGVGKVNGVDQRGITRPQGAHCDIGAFEAPPPPAPLPGAKPPGSAGGPPSALPGVRPAGAPGGVPNPLPVRRS